MNAYYLGLKYIAFAVLATFCNLLVQRTILFYGDSASNFLAAMALGTIAGLIVKYVLDKHWIFHQNSAKPETFILYSVTGLLTTLLFWGTEAFFWLVFSSDLMREFGAVLGLSVGYIVKYQLDRRFVFTDEKLGI